MFSFVVATPDFDLAFPLPALGWLSIEGPGSGVNGGSVGSSVVTRGVILVLVAAAWFGLLTDAETRVVSLCPKAGCCSSR